MVTTTRRRTAAAQEETAAPVAAAPSPAKGRKAAAAAAPASTLLPEAWVIRWMWVTTAIVSWDCSYQLLQPWSVSDSPIAQLIWRPYHTTYSKVDMYYGSESRDPWSLSQSQFNALEIVAQLAVILLARARSPAATLGAFTVSFATLYKTLLYFAMCANGSWKLVPSARMSNAQEVQDFITLFLIPNGAWIVIPTLACLSTGKQLLAALRA